MSHLHTFAIPDELDSQRFDLSAVKLSGLSRNYIRQIIDSGGAFLNKKRIWVAKFVVKTGDLMEIRTNDSVQTKFAHNIDLTNDSIVLETADFLVLNKPYGIAVDTNNNILSYLKKLNPSYSELFLAHRLDKDTSGLLIVAKSETVRAEFEKIFAQRKIRKIYRVLCFDTPNQIDGVINFPITQHSKGENKYFAVTNGTRNPTAKTAKTEYTLLQNAHDKRLSYLECHPHTGRPHQIRVHLRAMGNPVLGDKIYAEHLTNHPHWQLAPRQMLHAYRLQFTYHDTDYDLIAPLPPDFEKILDILQPPSACLPSGVNSL